MADESPIKPLTSPGVATAEGDLVMLDGPDGVAVTLTAEAARLTGESLIAAAHRTVERPKR